MEMLFCQTYLNIVFIFIPLGHRSNNGSQHPHFKSAGFGLQYNAGGANWPRTSAHASVAAKHMH